MNRYRISFDVNSCDDKLLKILKYVSPRFLIEDERPRAGETFLTVCREIENLKVETIVE